VSFLILKLCDHSSGSGDFSRKAVGTVSTFSSSTGMVTSLILVRSGSPSLGVVAIVWCFREIIGVWQLEKSEGDADR
jgi:hypothetical protein